MGKPRLIILIRHAQSEGNKSREIHQTTPDHRVPLTHEGRTQAHAAGLKLRSLLRPSDTLHFFTSPYRRTRETTEGILSSLTSSHPSPSPFPRHTIKVYEEPRLREQDFGNFQPSSSEMARMWQERADYGHFFYRIPNGESAADAYDRISGFNESLWRQFGEEQFASVCVLVTHGLMTRVFLMKWYHFSVEYFEDLRNVNHCEFVVMKLNQEAGKYELKNQLRTWSELRREKEREAERREPQSPVPIRKRWGGGGKEDEGGRGRGREVRRQNTADLFWDEELREEMERALEIEGGREGDEYPAWNGEDKLGKQQEKDGFPALPPSMLGSQKHKLSPAQQEILEGGRDGGGSRSGNVSRSGSPSTEEEAEVKGRLKSLPTRSSMAMALHGDLSVGKERRPASRARADTLGDQSDVDDDDDAVQEIRRQEIADRSYDGSVL